MPEQLCRVSIVGSTPRTAFGHSVLKQSSLRTTAAWQGIVLTSTTVDTGVVRSRTGQVSRPSHGRSSTYFVGLNMHTDYDARSAPSGKYCSIVVSNDNPGQLYTYVACGAEAFTQTIFATSPSAVVETSTPTPPSTTSTAPASTLPSIMSPANSPSKALTVTPSCQTQSEPHQHTHLDTPLHVSITTISSSDRRNDIDALRVHRRRRRRRRRCSRLPHSPRHPLHSPSKATLFFRILDLASPPFPVARRANRSK